MSKQIQFTDEQKSLIWSTKLQHSKATPEEAKAFMEVCEEYGLNPLLGDITFQKFETKWGPRVSYLISRDAYLKYAMKQDDFVNILSGVVREGDFFEVNVIDGVPIHKFGAKRGNIIGAWAVVKTKSRGNTIVFPDFKEYHSALSPKNPVWNSMPSAMIEKVAQSTALKRTFPLGVIFSSDDEVITQEEVPATVEQPTIQNDSIANELEAARQQKESEKPKQTRKRRTAAEKAEKVEQNVESIESVNAEQTLPKQQEETPAANPIEPVEQPTETVEKPTETVEQSTETVEKPTETEEQPAKEVETIEDTNQEETSTKEQAEIVNFPDDNVPVENVFEFISGNVGQSGNGTKFLRVQYKDGAVTKEFFARGDDKIQLFDEFEAGTKFTAKIEEVNGFAFVLSATVLAQAV